MSEIRVLIVEDHPMFASGLRALLDTDPQVSVVGTARTVADAVRRAAAERPQVVLMDLRLPDGDGVRATREILATCPETAILVLTMLEDEHSVAAAVGAGARGYLLKDSDDTEILSAVRAVHDGLAIFHTAVAPHLSRLVNPAPQRAARAFPQLTEREREILGLVARGLSNPEITAHLVLSPKTVRNHVSNIMAKIHAATRAQAIVLAREAGLG